jgi:hypothetical protein
MCVVNTKIRDLQDKQLLRIQGKKLGLYTHDNIYNKRYKSNNSQKKDTSKTNYIAESANEI